MRLAALFGCVAGALGCAADAMPEQAVDSSSSDGHGHTHVLGDASVPDDAAGDGGAAEASAAYDWPLPPGFPAPKVPEGSAVTLDKVELGRRLFYEERLSGNGTQSCASCHKQELAFTDGLAVGVGSTGEAHVRGSMSLVNVAYATSFTWANATLGSLEDQALVPLFGESPVELGLSGRIAEVLQTLGDDPSYAELFARAFPDEASPLSIAKVVSAIASFERTIVSGGSAYDRYLQGDTEALDDSARRGMDLFFGERLECFHCHGGFNLSGSVTHAGKVFDESTFHNNGLYNLDGEGAYPEDNQGLYAFTGDPADMGRFKAPTLRNVAVTAPYMHDGSIATLPEVIDHYAAGGRLIARGPHAGDGRASPVKSEMVAGFPLTAEEKADVLAFLESLTDHELLRDPRYADPESTEAPSR